MKKCLKMLIAVAGCFCFGQAEANETVHFACPAALAPVTGGPAVSVVLPDGKAVLASHSAAVALGVKKTPSAADKLVKVQASDGTEIYVLSAEADRFLADEYEPFLAQKKRSKEFSTWRVLGYMPWSDFSQCILSAVREESGERAVVCEKARMLFLQNLLSWITYLEECGYITPEPHPWEELESVGVKNWMRKFSFEESHSVASFLQDRCTGSRGHRTGTPLDVSREDLPFFEDGASAFDLNEESYLKSAETVRRFVQLWAYDKKISAYKKAHDSGSVELTEEKKELMDLQAKIRHEMWDFQLKASGLR